MIILAIKASLIVSIFWLFYKLMLEQESYYTSNRIFLLFGLIAALLIPYISLPQFHQFQGSFDQSITAVISQSHDVSATTVTVDGPTSNAARSTPVALANWTKYIFYLYLFGVLVLSINLLMQFAAIVRKIVSSPEKINDLNSTIVFLEGNEEPCSFFKYVFINPARYEPATYEQILAHEQVHAAKRHSLDLLLSELAVIFMWFNPLVWKYRRAVEKNLEFETDQAILDQKKYTPPTYQNNLLLVAVAQKPLVLTTNYNQSLLKERIMKMNAKKSHSYNYWKYLFILPVLIFSALLLNQPALKGKQSFLTDQAPSTLLQTECQALLQAVRSSNIEKVRSLLDSSSDPNCSYRFDGEPRSPLVAAARNGDLEIGKLLLESGADVEFQSRGDEPPLMSAARNGHLEFVQMLIAAGAEVDRIKKGDGTALINAVKSQQLEIAKLLLEHGADPYLEVPGDEYAMYHARISNNATMISLLKSYEKGL